MISAGLLLGYWLLMKFGGDYTMLGNLGQKIDLWLVGDNHLYHGEGVAFDPEGFLSTFPAIVNVVIGYYAGVFIRSKGNNYETIAKLLLAGAALICVAYFWDLLFPINKKLWTSPFVLYTCGLDLIYIIEILGKKNWTYFFEVFGKNPLFIYLLSEILVTILYMMRVGKSSLFRVINDTIYQKLLPGAIGSLLFALSYMMVCWLVGYWMDKNKKYVRV
jgi:predicted acyltransferase